jgi:hypothetical protein
MTNGSKSVSWWKKYSHLIDGSLISYHWENANKNHIIEVAKIARKNGVFVKINILLKKEKFEESYILGKEIAESLDEVLVELRPLRLHHGIRLIEYTDKQLKTLKETNRFGNMPQGLVTQRIFSDSGEIIYPDQIMLEKKNCWKGWNCYIGTTCLKINCDGVVLRGNCDVGEPLGTIYNEDFKIPTEPVICDKDFCKCVTDIMIRKEKQ